MNRVERLAGIRVKLVGLLKIAERRTPGKWLIHGMSVVADDGFQIASTNYADNTGRLRTNDADFIAFCAGNAEEGWRSTVAQIDHISELLRHPSPEVTATAEAMADVILSEMEGAL